MKGYEGDSYLQTSTGIQRHRLRALFGRADNGNTLEQTGRTAVILRVEVRVGRRGKVGQYVGAR